MILAILLCLSGFEQAPEIESYTAYTMRFENHKRHRWPVVWIEYVDAKFRFECIGDDHLLWNIESIVKFYKEQVCR